jgi:tRNA (guanine37-N1)-methyltransferase
LRIDIITIFPEYFSPLGVSLIGKAAQRGDILFAIHDLRSWAGDVHRTVDDAPFGGGPGMVMKPEPWGEALNAISLLAGDAAATSAPGPDPGTGGAGTGGPGPAPGAVGGQRGAVLPELIVPTPAGEVFTQAAAAELAGAGHLIFACGRYEGIDGRVVEDARKKMRVREITIGDYVLAGGEPAVLVMIEAVCRLLPGVLGNAESAADDSFGAGAGPMSGLVEGPVYTRPRVWRGLEVPPVLVSGDHGQIARWRREQALLRTGRNRPDLATRLSRSGLSDEDHAVLSEAGFADNGEDVAH